MKYQQFKNEKYVKNISFLSSLARFMHLHYCLGNQVRTQENRYETIFEIGLLGGINRSLFFCPMVSVIHLQAC